MFDGVGLIEEIRISMPTAKRGGKGRETNIDIPLRKVVVEVSCEPVKGLRTLLLRLVAQQAGMQAFEGGA